MSDTRRIWVTEVHNFGGFFGGDTVTLSATPWPDGDEETLTIDERALANVRERHLIGAEMLLELEKTMGIMAGTTICGLADGTAWATRTFVNKFYDEFAAKCREGPEVGATVPLTISRGRLNVLTPMGSNTR